LTDCYGVDCSIFEIGLIAGIVLAGVFIAIETYGLLKKESNENIYGDKLE
jgi:hypothetical protein